MEKPKPKPKSKSMIRGRAVVHRHGDVTTVRVVDYHGERQGAVDFLSAGAAVSPPPDLQTLKGIDLIAFNQSAEQSFLAMLEALCAAMPDGVPLVGARAETAYRLGVSTETAKRYIEKFAFAFSAPFRIKDGMIFKKHTA